MPLSFTCPKCFKSHSKIDDSMLGKKARCHCGTEVRLGPKPGTNPDAQDPNGPVVVEPFVYDENPALPSPPPATQPVFPPQAYDSPPVLQSPSPATWSAGNGSGLPSYPGSSVGAQAASRQASSIGPKKFSQQSIIRLVIGMTSGTLSILFSILCFWFVASYGEWADVSPGRMEFLGNGNQNSAAIKFLTAIAVLTVVILIVATATLVAGFIQFIGSWSQAMRQNSSHPWPDVLAVAVSVISIVAILATFIYANIQISELYSAQDRASGISERALSQMSGDRAAKFRKQANEQKKAVRDVVWGVRWTLIKQVLIHAIIPGLVFGLSLFRLFKE